MRTSKADLQNELAEEKKLRSILDMCLLEMVRFPERVEWFTRGKGDSLVSWGVVRMTGAAGGYLIRRQGKDYMNVGYLDEGILAARERMELASSLCNESRQQAIDEYEISQIILRKRTERLDAIYTAKAG